MKAFFILVKIITIGIFWSVFFVDGVRVIMLKNWRFDIVRPEHWQYAKDLWLSGWVISSAKEWAFVLILLTSIPLWLTGWATLSMINYSKIIKIIFGLPIKALKSIVSNKTRQVANKLATKTVVKKKSYKEVRPQARDGSTKPKAPAASTSKTPQQSKPALPTSSPLSTKKASSSTFDHALFDFDDDDDDFNFDLDAPVEKKPEPKKPTPRRDKPEQQLKKPKAEGEQKQVKNAGTSSVFDAIKQKGYDIVSSITIKNNLVDFIALSNDKIAVFLVDKENGDWLADEEKFNGEEPLWFSENSHRISPVRRVSVAREAIVAKISEAGFNQKVDAYVVNQMNNIINAEDMLDIWQEQNVFVTRIDRGTPKEIPLLNKALEETDDQMSKEDIEKIKKLLRGIN